MSDWADKKAEEALKSLLSPTVTLDDATALLAAMFRVVEAMGVQRGLDAASEVVRRVMS